MKQFEDQLRDALRRQEPSPDFAERVLARLPQTGTQVSWWRQRGFGVAAAVMIALLAGGGYEAERARERREAERVRGQLAFALELTEEKLTYTKNKLTKHLENR